MEALFESTPVRNTQHPFGQGSLGALRGMVAQELLVRLVVHLTCRNLRLGAVASIPLPVIPLT